MAFEVEFLSCVVDRAHDLKVLESDSHFSDFTGVHPSKIHQGKLVLLDLLMPKERETVLKQLCKKDSPYVYLDFYIKNKNGEYILVHCLAQNVEGTTTSRIAMADVSQSQKKSERLKKRADSMNRLIDLVESGVCLFKVNQDMHLETMYMNQSCSRYFDAPKDALRGYTFRMDEYLHPDDRSKVYQAVGNAMATKKPINMEIRLKKGKNEFVWYKLDSAIHSYADDGCPVFHAVYTDISKIKEAEHKADSERDIMINLFKNLPGPQFCADVNTPFIMDIVSADFMKMIGYTRHEFFEALSGDLTHLISPDDAERAEAELIAGVKNATEIRTIYTLRTKDGRTIDVVDRRKIVESGSNRSTVGILREASAAKLDEELNLID